MKDGGWSNTDKGWVLDPSQAARVRDELAAEMARIDRFHADLPKCTLCGQRCNRLDTFGLCSKVTETHKARRGGLQFAPAGRRR